MGVVVTHLGIARVLAVRKARADKGRREQDRVRGRCGARGADAFYPVFVAAAVTTSLVWTTLKMP